MVKRSALALALLASGCDDFAALRLRQCDGSARSCDLDAQPLDAVLEGSAEASLDAGPDALAPGVCPRECTSDAGLLHAAPGAECSFCARAVSPLSGRVTGGEQVFVVELGPGALGGEVQVSPSADFSVAPQGAALSAMPGGGVQRATARLPSLPRSPAPRYWRARARGSTGAWGPWTPPWTLWHSRLAAPVSPTRMDNDRDGFVEFAVGVPGAPGRVALFEGSSRASLGPFGARAELRDPEPASGAFGGRVAVAGDLNGDGAVELAVATTPSDATPGRLYLFDVLSGAASAALRSGDTSGDHLGAAMTAAGDLDGDGYGDLLVGAPRASNGATRPGAAFVVLGRPGPIAGAAFTLLRLPGSGAAELPGSGPYPFQFGASVAGGADLDGDGRDDLVVGAPYWPANSQPFGGGTIDFPMGLVALGYWRGASGFVVDRLRAEGDPAITWDAAHPRRRLGSGVAMADHDGDGVVEVLALEYCAPSSCDVEVNGAFALTRRGTGYAQSWLAEAEGRAADPTALTSSDLDGDGLAELVLGSSSLTDGMAPPTTYGRLDVLSFRSGGPRYASVLGMVPDNLFGRTVAAPGDLDGDGFEDLLVSSPALGSSAPTGPYVLWGGSELTALARAPLGLAGIPYPGGPEGLPLAALRRRRRWL